MMRPTILAVLMLASASTSSGLCDPESEQCIAEYDSTELLQVEVSADSEKPRRQKHEQPHRFPPQEAYPELASMQRQYQNSKITGSYPVGEADPLVHFQAHRPFGDALSLDLLYTSGSKLHFYVDHKLGTIVVDANGTLNALEKQATALISSDLASRKPSAEGSALELDVAGIAAMVAETPHGAPLESSYSNLGGSVCEKVKCLQQNDVVTAKWHDHAGEPQELGLNVGSEQCSGRCGKGCTNTIGIWTQRCLNLDACNMHYDGSGSGKIEKPDCRAELKAAAADFIFGMRCGCGGSGAVAGSADLQQTYFAEKRATVLTEQKALEAELRAQNAETQAILAEQREGVARARVKANPEPTAQEKFEAFNSLGLVPITNLAAKEKQRARTTRWFQAFKSAKAQKAVKVVEAQPEVEKPQTMGQKIQDLSQQNEQLKVDVEKFKAKHPNDAMLLAAATEKLRATKKDEHGKLQVKLKEMQANQEKEARREALNAQVKKEKAWRDPSQWGKKK